MVEDAEGVDYVDVFSDLIKCQHLIKIAEVKYLRLATPIIRDREFGGSNPLARPLVSSTHGYHHR